MRQRTIDYYIITLLSLGLLVATSSEGLNTDRQSPRSSDKGQCIPAMSACSLITSDLNKKCCFPYRCEPQHNERDTAKITGICVNGAQDPIKNTGKCPHMNSLEQILGPIREGEEFDRTVRMYEETKEKYIHAAAYRGDASKNFWLSVRELNLETRAHYADTVAAIGDSIYPLIIARDVDQDSGLSGVGGTYTLYLRDGTSRTIQPTSREYEIRKSLSHIPVGLFSVVAPYFFTPGDPQLKSSFRSFYKKLSETYEASLLGPLQLSADLESDAISMLNITKKHMDMWASTRTAINPPAFEKYASEMFPFVDANIRKAANLQVKAVHPALAAWKTELGQEWKDVHVLIPTIWPVSIMNPRLQIFAKLMKPEQVRSQVFIVDSAGSTKTLRGILGKIIGDRAAALTIFGTRTRTRQEFTFNLAGRQDLMSLAAEDSLNVLLDPLPQLNMNLTISI